MKVYTLTILLVLAAVPGNKTQDSIIQLPRPNSGTFTFAQAESRKFEILFNKPSQKLEDWKNPYMGFCIHIGKDNRITVYNHWLKLIPEHRKPRINQSVGEVKKLLDELPLEGNPAVILVTSELPLKDSKTFSNLLEVLFAPSVQLYYVKRIE